MKKPLLTFNFHTKTTEAVELKEYIKQCKKIVKKNSYHHDESSLVCPADKETLKRVKKMVEVKAKNPPMYIIVIGIGGSNLGTKAVYDALSGSLDAFTDEYPKIIFLDTVSAPLIKDLVDILVTHTHQPEDILINVVTKSGSTTETIANFETLMYAIEDYYGSIVNRVVVTTNKNSKLWNKAKAGGLSRLPIPEKVGGRFSVFTAVGLFPLAVAGVDIDQLLQGARTMRSQCLSIKNNPAFQSAQLMAIYRKRGVRINNSFFFNPELESLGLWYRQLLAESIGKLRNKDKKKVREGITPIVSIGSTDLHSQAQLYLGGPQDKFTCFYYAKQLPTQVKVPRDLLLPKLVNHIEGKSYKKIMEAIYHGVRDAYEKNQQPFMEVHIPIINAHTLGQMMQWKMMEIMYLAQLLNVDAFNQPSVEDYKKVTRRLLKH